MKPSAFCRGVEKILALRYTTPMSATNGSPVTGVIDESIVIVDFGKYAGKSVEEISELDPNFYERLAVEKENGIFAIRRHRDKTFRLYVNPLTMMDQ
ncbi:MAG TPA: hypothetical protein DCS07_10165 [Bdellovibrionales bacterium]|nr:hypothetical protein [Bdellovibrionales bacterium]